MVFKTIDCYVKVVKILSTDNEKIKALIHYRIPDVDVKKFKIRVRKPEVRITIPDEAFLLPAIQVATRALARDLMDHIDGIEKVTYIETYVKQAPQ